MSESLIHLVTALPAEAKPVASWFSLKRVAPERGFPVYRNQHISLVVSGVGKANAAAATGYLFAANHYPANAIWVNLGIVAHAQQAVGDALLAHKIVDGASRKQWFPPLAFTPPCRTESLETVDQPEFDYRREGAWDMEASGFYATALRFGTAELVHCLKVVSDNSQSPGRGLDADSVYRLVGAQLDTLDRLLGQLGTLANLLHEIRVPEAILQRYTTRWHFTQSQQHQLRETLTRWQTLEPASELWSAQIQAARGAKAVLRELRANLAQCPVHL